MKSEKNVMVFCKISTIATPHGLFLQPTMRTLLLLPMVFVTIVSLLCISVNGLSLYDRVLVYLYVNNTTKVPYSIQESPEMVMVTQLLF